MAENVIENPEQSTGKKENPYKTDIFILKSLAVVAMNIIVASLIGLPGGALFLIGFGTLFAACIYGRMTGHNPSKPCDFRESSRHDQYTSDYRSATYGMPGYNVDGNYTGSDTAIGGISD